MTDNKWMFGGTSDPNMLKDSPKKQGLYDRTLPSGYTSGGLNIGDSDASGQSTSRKAAAAAYRATLDQDKLCNIPDRLPDAKKRSAYDYSARTQAPVDDDHPLGASNMNALGDKALSKMDKLKLENAEAKRKELQTNRFDIISCLEKEANPENSPRARNAAELLIGKPIPGRTDDGILLIGRTAAEETSDKKTKQAMYMEQLNADTGVKFGLGENYDPSADSLNTYKSYKRIETTGTTGLNISSGASSDMTASMKELDFSMKRKAQEAYRAVLKEQQAAKAEVVANEKAADANIDTNASYFMQQQRTDVQ